ncbi:MAG: AIR synthase related protein [Marmoricola sp.]
MSDHAAGHAELVALAERLRYLPGVLAKSSIGAVADVFGGGDWYTGPGDDGAVVADGDRNLVVGGEAMLPAFVAADPYGAGISAVLANVNDLAAMGAEPLAIVDTVVGPRETVVRVLEGLKWAGDAYGVPIVGGHLTETDGPPSLSAFGLGRADAVLSATRTEPGQALLVCGCFEGRMREDFFYFPSFDEREGRLDGDVRVLATLARSGAAVAAKDVSMAGLVGSLAMLLEANRLGVEIDLDLVPLPVDTSLGDWLSCFPCLVFLVTTPEDRVQEVVDGFVERGLAAVRVGTLDGTGLVRLRSGADVVTVFDLAREAITRLRR